MRFSTFSLLSHLLMNEPPLPLSPLYANSNVSQHKNKKYTAFHRTEGDDRGNQATIWESVVFEGVAYAVGFYLAFDVLSPIISFIKEAIVNKNDDDDDDDDDDDSSGVGVGVGNQKQDASIIEENSN
jgi:hypothetical protein